ncbi:hypothetical protein [Leptolyngbya ohadii]|uniref:hypothetical protein n=1 Tax=Leptolyngbya ohadii TaxID=1962290 RepID=UPI000B59E0C3|nr:hypothetical protein [Leptolyngbya ohadii]
MEEIQQLIHDPFLQDFIHNFLSGEITLLTGILWVAIAAGCAIVGGAIGGMILAGQDLGYRLSAMIGGLFGPAAVIPSTILGLLCLKLVF